MKLKILITTASCIFTLIAYTQTDILTVPPGILLPQDSLTRVQLLDNMRGWLSQKEKPDRENSFIMAADLPATSALMRELRGVERNARLKDSVFYKCYLTNVIPEDSGLFLMQLAYLGAHENVPELRASYKVLARRQGDQFYFSSPLQQYTANWKTKQIGNCLFRYKTRFNPEKAAEYQKKVASYDKRLTSRPQLIDFYCCDNLVEAAQLTGVDYKSDYNGFGYEELSGFADNHTIVLCGNTWANDFTTWDPHDTWHERLHYLAPSERLNRPVDEACAYLYGGSWRIYTPADVLRMFAEYAGAHQDANWLALYKDGTNFIPPPKILKISYAINALIIRQLENEKGFAAVLELLNCGKKEQGDANYFTALQKLTGVDEAGFNAYVWSLVKTIRS